MKNYLVRVQKNVENYFYTVVCANDLKHACRLADSLTDGITATEYYDSIKHDYEYTDEYTCCYAYVVQEL